MEKTKISVVIPTYNEEKDIEECLKTLLAQSYKNLEIIVVDDCSTDKTREIIKKFTKVILIECEHKGTGFSRNRGAKQAKGKILVFVDADMFFDRNYIENLTKPIINGLSFGTEERYQKASNQNNVWSRCWGTYVKERPPHVKKGNVFRAILKSKFFELGMFDPKYGYADDLTFYFNYNIKSDIADDAFCYHKNPASLKEVFKQSRWIGASLNSFFFSKPVIKYFTPIFMVLISPATIIFLSIQKCYKNKNFRLLIPWMFIFMAVRYFGTINGLFRKIYKGINVR